MKFILKTLIITLSILLLNCKNNTPQLEYKYADKPEALTCKTSNTKLYLEALYSFEEDILKYYGKNKRTPNAQPNLTYAYNQFIRYAVYSNSVPYENIISQHSLEVFNALKNDNTLWDSENAKSHLNYNSPLVKCISENIKDSNLKTTFNSLLSINDLSPKLFGPPLTSKYRNALSDKHLASYIAFDLYYARLFDIDHTKINFESTNASHTGNKQ